MPPQFLVLSSLAVHPYSFKGKKKEDYLVSSVLLGKVTGKLIHMCD